MADDQSAHLRAFADVRPKYERLSVKLRELLDSLLRAGGIETHVIESRAKTVESFSDKLSRLGKYYGNPLSDVSDLCGCRIILYYADDVDRAASILRDEFEVVEEEKSHQPDSLEVDRFGYISLHLVVKLEAKRKDLVEWSEYKDFRAEIQTRTVI